MTATTFDPATVWVAIAVLAAGTYGLRAVFLLGIDGRADLPASVRGGLDLVPVAVLTALAVPAVALGGDGTSLALATPRAAAGAAAVAVAWRTGSLLLTVGAGMGVLWALQWLGVLG